MDLKKTGAMIAQKRKEKNLTQKELAERLGVTDKAVSRWETGAGFPDVSLLQPLSQVLGISITELISGEPLQPETAAEQSDNALLSALAYTVKKNRSMIALLLALPGLWLLLAPAYVSGVTSGIPHVLAAGLLAAAAALVFWEKKPAPRTARLLAMAVHLGALVLEILPGSAVLIFAGPDYYNRNVYSCFDLTLVGFANFAPFLAGVLTAAAALMMLPPLFGKLPHLRKPAFACTVTAGILILAPLVFWGQEWLTASGLAVSLLLLASAGFQHSAR